MVMRKLTCWIVSRLVATVSDSQSSLPNLLPHMFTLRMMIMMMIAMMMIVMMMVMIMMATTVMAIRSRRTVTMLTFMSMICMMRLMAATAIMMR